MGTRRPQWSVSLHCLHTFEYTSEGAFYHYFTLLYFQNELVPIFGLQPQKLAVAWLESIHPQEEGHSFAEGPSVVAEQDFDAIIFVVVDEVEVGSDCPLLEPSVQQSECVSYDLGT